MKQMQNKMPICLPGTNYYSSYTGHNSGIDLL